MSEIAKQLATQLFDSLKGVKEVVQAAAPGLENFAAEAKAEVSRLSVQGANELAGALFNQNAFVPYGPGQYTPAPEHEQNAPEQQQERGR